MEGKQITTRTNRNEIDSYEKGITEVHSLSSRVLGRNPCHLLEEVTFDQGLKEPVFCFCFPFLLPPSM